MIPKEIVDEILSRADIVDVISSYIPVEKKGNSYKAVCPFHADTNPSLNISKQKQIFKCFVCDKGGNAFSFVSDYEHISYSEAVKHVASLISFDDPSLHEKTIVNKNQKLLQALNDTKDFYHYILKTNLGIDGQVYLKKREIDENMQDYFSLGFAPFDSNKLIKSMESKKHDVKILDDVGVTIRENGNIADRFKGRVIFPIFDEFSNVIGFSGRIINGEGPKYVNTSSTILFNKSEVLYTYQNAKKEARIVKYVYIVEGFMDVFALYKVGINSCIALMGTAFTNAHLRMLRKLNAEIRIMLDGDEPGQHAIQKMVLMLEKEKLSFRVVDYQGIDLDPDEIYKNLGKDKLLQITNSLISGNEFLIKRGKKAFDLKSIDGKKKFVQSLVGMVNYYQTRLEKEEYLKLLAKEADISYNAVLDLAKTIIKEKEEIPVDKNINVNKKSKNKSRLTNIEQELLFHILNEKNALNLFLENPNDHFFDDLYGALFNYILDDFIVNKSINPASLINKLEEDPIKNKVLIDELVRLSSLQEDCFPPYSDDMFKEVIIALRDEIKSLEKKEDLQITYQKYSSPLEVAKEIQKKRGS